MSDEFDRVKSELQGSKEANQLIRKENKLLKNTVSDLSNIEINGVPENKSENLINIVVQLGKVVSNSFIVRFEI
uniref:SFRICE_040031 n=1 Tax=Spodoptera frugiperda TaxID=7108 RepID=A0A2H1VZ12_SPOFR